MLKRPFSAATLAVLTVAFLLFLSIDASAGVTGKMSGAVYDAASGQPVEGATVRVDETNLTTKTDMDGEFFIMNVPSGKYDVSISYVGYESVTKTGVRILVDLTTPVDFELTAATIALDQRMVVSATNPIIQRDLTSSRIIFTRDRLETLPNNITIQSVLMNYPGVIVDASNSMHVRGGRSGQISYYFDGFLVQDPFVNRSGIHIIPSALEELSLTSGGYTAEYGEALSGVVNAVTREGGTEYHGSAKIYEGFTHAYDRFNADWSSLKRVGNRSASFDLSGPIPGLNPQKITFSTSAEYLKSPTSLPHSGSISKTGVAMIAVQPTPRMKIKTNVSYHNQYGDLYEHRDVNGRSYDYNLNGLPKFERESYLVGITDNYNFDDNMILTASVSHFHTETKSAPEGLMNTYWDEWQGYSVDSNGAYNGTIDDDNYLNAAENDNPFHRTGFTTGDDFDPTYRFRRTEYSSLNVSLLSQINKTNQLKGGIEYRKYDVKWDFKQFFNDQPYGEQYDSKPVYASAYLQDKMEYRDFVMNFGIRYDYHNADISYYSRPNAKTAFWKKADSKARISPRLGVSFPISEKSVMHFNYGAYYQEPRYSYMYTNLDGDITSGYPLLGNPDLEPERTISYELGLDHLIGDDLRLDVTAYFKDVADLVTTRSTYKVAGTPNAVTFFNNDDYGSVKGIDVALEKLPVADHLSASVAYSYMVAAGNGSNALEPYYTYLTAADAKDSLPPVTEYALDFDQRHTVSAVMDYRVPADWKGSLFGVPLPGNWGVNMIGHYGSGLPYSPTNEDGNRMGEPNQGRMPAYYTVDLRFNKDFVIPAGQYHLSLFVEADNLFNRRNVINVYSRTGQADNDESNPTAGASLDQAELDRLDHLYDHNPQNYSAPRTIRTGMKLSF